MATYNNALYLQQAIDSVVHQTFAEWELVIVNDGSTDETAAILARCDDPRITVHTLPNNRGRSAARNVALSHATGRYIAICDSDDLSHARRFELQVAFLDAHPDISIVSAYLRAFSTATTTRLEFPLDSRSIQRRFEAGKMGAAHGASMIRTECFRHAGVYCEELRSPEDFELFLRFVQHYRFRTLPHVLLDYRNSLGAVPLRLWREQSRAHRYALYRSRRTAVPPVQTQEEFSRGWRTQLAVHTIDMLRLARFSLKAHVFSHYSAR